MCFGLVIFIVQLYSIFHAQFLSSTHAYSMLHILVKYVQAVSFQIRHRSVLDLDLEFITFSGESSYFEDYRNVLHFTLGLSFFLDSVRECPSPYSQLATIFTHSQIQLQNWSLTFQLLLNPQIYISRQFMDFAHH